MLCVASLSAEPTVEEGKTIFQNVCAQCHARDMKTPVTGPALAGFEERWTDYPREDLYRWIRNSQALINEGHPRAVELWQEWQPTIMTNNDLTDEEIESVIMYINDAATAQPVTAVQPGATAAEETGGDNFLYWILFIILAVVALILMRIINNLNQIAAAQEGTEPAPSRSILQTLSSRSVVGFVVFALVILGGYTTVSNAIDFGRQQGYAPDQPIEFSHEIHAGIQGIDCQYCHDGARRSKHAIIPAASTCMNCHVAIKTGTQTGTAEITKIFASIGYNPNDNTYIDYAAYENMPEDSIKAIYTKWIGDQYLVAEGKTDLDRFGQSIVEDEWENIRKALTNPQKKKIPGPIEWVRIHNLPDHVYFSHEQHVAIGKIECQQCHGTVEEMALMQQYAPLSMGWCVNCHRQTEVQFKGNVYYESYQRYHEELAAGQRNKVTVEDIGGLECQKCHY